MKILIVHSCNAVNDSSQYTFIKDQSDALKYLGLDIDFFCIRGHGPLGYLRNYTPLIKKLKEFEPDIIHAHYGLSGVLSVIQRKVPVIITFHNGETLTFKANLISSLASFFSAYNIYVAQHVYDLSYLKFKKKSLILPCGIDLDNIQIIPKEQAKLKMKLPTDKINILFAGSFHNSRKNVKLANEAIALLNRDDLNLIELKGWSRQEVNLLLCGSDMMLLTSKSEGSPQVVKEAMACNCPIVASDIADIKELFGNTNGCYLTSFEPSDVSEKINMALSFGKQTKGRERIIEIDLDNRVIAKKIFDKYKDVYLSKRN